MGDFPLSPCAPFPCSEFPIEGVEVEDDLTTTERLEVDLLRLHERNRELCDEITVLRQNLKATEAALAIFAPPDATALLADATYRRWWEAVR